MAKKRMFSVDVVDTDDFLNLPTSAQALYFHLGMHGDDDGFMANPKMIMRMCGCSPKDLALLISQGFIIALDRGVIAVRDWMINNDLKNDRYHETIYVAQKARLRLDESKRYILVPEADTACIRSGDGT